MHLIFKILVLELALKDPLVSFIVITYNQEKYIEQALEGAFSQDYQNIEFIISDDNSPDRTFELIQKYIAHKKKFNIRINKNSTNLGLIEHVNKCIQMAKGEIIVFNAGDDISQPTRTTKSIKLLNESEKNLIVHSSVEKIDDDKNKLGLLKPPIYTKNMSVEDLSTSMSTYIGATLVAKKSFFNRFGPISYKNAYEDLVYAFRAGLLDAIKYIDEPLVLYRWQVGISTKQAGKKFSDQMKARIKNLNVSYDVLKQRLDDLSTLPSHRLYKKLQNKMQRLLDQKKYQLSAHGIKKWDYTELLSEKTFFLFLFSYFKEKYYIFKKYITSKD